MKTFEQFFLEEKLDADDRKKLSDDDYGVIIKDKDGNVIERAYPMPDARHVESAARMYPFAKRKYDSTVVAELRRKIIAKAKEFNVPDSKIQSVIDDKPGEKTVKEYFGPEDDDTSGTSEFDEYIVSEPDDCYTESSVERPKFPEEFNRIFNNIIAPIGEYSDKMRKKPTGNQNCQLCVWCTEARFRGIDALPRPVYSPRDPVLEIPGEAIVYNPKKIKINSYADVASEVTKAGNGCRIYVHVNWKDSQGGHEFILLRIENKNYYADPQVALLGELTKHCRYFTDINYKNSYLCRLDDKEFNEKLFNKWNDPSTVLAWDESKDIPYMKENGMLDEYNESRAVQESANDSIHMRPATEDDLDKIYNWKLETMDPSLQNDPKTQKFIRNDAKEHLSDTQMIMDGETTIGMLEACMIDDGEWRYIGEIYLIPSYRGKGIGSDIMKKEIEQYPRIRLMVSMSNDHAIELYKSLGFKIVKTLQENNTYIMEYERDTVQESSNIHDETFYRYEYDGEGIYEALRKQLTPQEWKSFKQSDAAKWLPVPPDYEKGDESFFTEKGNEKFKKNTLPYIKKHLKPSQIRSYDCNLNSKYIRYRDEYQVVYNKTKTFQESVIQNIKNKTNPFEKNLVYHISPEGTLDGQVFKPRVPEYLDKYDPSKPDFEDVENPRICFSPSIEGALNAILVNIGRWKTANKLRDWYVYIPEKPLKEYKHRTTKQLVDEKKVYDANITKEVWIEEPVRLKQYGIIRIDSVNDKTRKKGVPSTTGESKKRNYYDFKWHWLVKPKVLKDVKYDYSPLEVCKDMIDVLSDYKYGIPENGRIVAGSEHDYDTKWKLQSPEEFEKNRGGICYDYVEFEEGYLDAYGIKCKKYYMSTNLPGNDTHTFILVEDGKGGYIYPESSFKDAEGVHEVKSIEEACKIVVNGFWKINNNRKNTDSFEWHVWEYTGHPAYGSNMDTCMKYYCGWNDKTKQPKNPIYEGVAKDDDPKPIKESFSYFARFVNDFKNNKE